MINEYKDTLSVFTYDEMQVNKYYLDQFGIIPSRYSYGLEKYEIKTDKIKKEHFEKIFGTNDFYVVHDILKQEVPAHSVQDGRDKILYDDSGCPFGHNHIESNYIAVCESKKIIVKIGTYWIQVYYDFNDTSFDVEGFTKLIKKSVPKRAMDFGRKDAEVGIVIYENGNFSVMESKINSTKIDVNLNYNDGFDEIDKKITDFISSEDRKSGIVLLNGAPGTGKTYYIRNLITRCSNKKFILIPPALCSKLASPDFITFLIENKNSIFILEDCEDAIRDRGACSFNSAVSAILNMSDGIMSDIFNGRFICTFNCNKSEIDTAVMRKGRCVVDYEFGPLSVEKTNNLFKSLGVEYTSKDEMTIADIFNFDKDEIKTTKKIGF